MENKFTIKDFLVYYLTGFYVVIVLALLFLKVDSISFCLLEKYSTLIIIFSIPLIYLIGQTTHGIDLILFEIAISLWKFNFNNKFLKSLRYYFNTLHVDGIVIIKNSDRDLFWKKVNRLQIKNKYSHLDYWILMNDLFKGLFIVSFISLIVSILFLNKINIITFLLLSIIFFHRASVMALNFYKNVLLTWEISEENI